METQEAALENADKAYRTAGLSANAYMETVTSFAASLKQSLGDEKAWQLADYADQAVVDMSDNANKMGTDMESIQNAYQGFGFLRMQRSWQDTRPGPLTCQTLRIL